MTGFQKDLEIGLSLNPNWIQKKKKILRLNRHVYWTLIHCLKLNTLLLTLFFILFYFKIIKKDFHGL